MSLVKWCCVYQLVKLCVSEQIENALFKSICQPFDKRPFNRCESNKTKNKATTMQQHSHRRWWCDEKPTTVNA